MDTQRKRRLEAYIKNKVAAAFKSHSVQVDVDVQPDKEKIAIDVKSKTITLYSIGQDPDIHRIASRMGDISLNYFNTKLSVITLSNSLLTRRPISFDVSKQEFRSWITHPF